MSLLGSSVNRAAKPPPSYPYRCKLRRVCHSSIMQGCEHYSLGRGEKGEGSPMPYYMVQLSYTKEAVANLVQNP